MQRYQNIVANSNTGLPVNGAQVYVLNYGTSTQSSIFSDNGITPASQPLQTDSLGSFYFYAANGHYTVTVYINGVLVATIPDVLLQDAGDHLVVDITGGTIDGTTVGATTPASGAFTPASISGGTIDNAVIGGVTPAAATITSLNGSSLAGRRNLIINGNFAVNQRVVSGTVTLAAGIYGHDRWKGGAAGATYTFAASGVDTTLTISAGSLQQVIAAENVSGTTYTLSWTGTAQARFNGGTYAASPLPITGITANTNLTIEFNAGTVGQVQVELGATATPFERHLFKDELENCLYYYEKSYDYATAPGSTTATGGAKFQLSNIAAAIHAATIMLNFSVPKRGTPTVTTYSYTTGASGKIRDVTGAADITPSLVTPSTKSVIVDATASTSSVNVNMLVQWTAEAEL